MKGSQSSQESRVRHCEERPNRGNAVQLTMVSPPPRSCQTQEPEAARRTKRPPEDIASVKEADPHKPTPPSEHAKETPGTSQTDCGSLMSCTISERSTVAEGEIMEEKPKPCKNRRRRRKGACQQVVGLPRCPPALPPVLLWFRRDLRLCDNPALAASLEADAPVIPIFIWSPEEEEGPGITVATGGACKSTENKWIHASALT